MKLKNLITIRDMLEEQKETQWRLLMSVRKTIEDLEENEEKPELIGVYRDQMARYKLGFEKVRDALVELEEADWGC